MSDHRLKDRPAAPNSAPTSAAGPAEVAAGVHLTLAARIAQRGRLRAERAARLARLRPEAGETAGEIVGEAAGETAGEANGEAPGPRPAITALAAVAAVPVPDPSLPVASPISTAAPALGGRAPSDAQLALEEFLRALTGASAPARPAPRGAAAEVLPFQRQGEAARTPAIPVAPAPVFVDAPALVSAAPPDPAPAPTPAALAPAEPVAPAACDLDRLPGAGPGLVWALRRAGLRRLAEVAALEEVELATRLGPLGRLVPAAAWIATARAGTDLV